MGLIVFLVGLITYYMAPICSLVGLLYHFHLSESNHQPKFGSWIMCLAAKDAKTAKNMQSDRKLRGQTPRKPYAGCESAAINSGKII